MTTGRLAAAVSAAVTSPDHQRKAREVAAQLASEDGATCILAELGRLNSDAQPGRLNSDASARLNRDTVP
jgi:hypothetical protein